MQFQYVIFFTKKDKNKQKNILTKVFFNDIR